ncbi:MAG TPA: hypothetical protein VKZ89_03965, partial [Thermobifida alba]|nr:hypothetical protein [Thermobifida alba]
HDLAADLVGVLENLSTVRRFSHLVFGHAHLTAPAAHLKDGTKAHYFRQGIREVSSFRPTPKKGIKNRSPQEKPESDHPFPLRNRGFTFARRSRTAASGGTARPEHHPHPPKLIRSSTSPAARG